MRRTILLLTAMVFALLLRVAVAQSGGRRVFG
jgi:hypothetical protein